MVTDRTTSWPTSGLPKFSSEGSTESTGAPGGASTEASGRMQTPPLHTSPASTQSLSSRHELAASMPGAVVDPPHAATTSTKHTGHGTR